MRETAPQNHDAAENVRHAQSDATAGHVPLTPARGKSSTVAGTNGMLFGFQRRNRAMHRTTPAIAGIFSPCRKRPAVWGMTLPSVSDQPEEPVIKPTDAPSDRRTSGSDRDMGAALRSVYQRTVDETVPDDLMALLGKLD
jgi:hypothetical protein